MISSLHKASIWKRAAALLLDLILICVIAVGGAYLLSVTLGYDSRYEKLEQIYLEYENTYGISFDLSDEAYENLTEEELKQYNDAYEALLSDRDAMYTYTMLINLTLVITTLGILFAFVILEFLVPKWLGHGQTIGKKVFGLGVMQQNGVKLPTVALFIRTILGKYTIETMVPVLLVIMIYFGRLGIVGTIVLGLLFVLQLMMIISTYTNSPIHDLLAKTVVVDMSCQMIFDTEEAMLAHEKKVAAEKAAKADY